MKTKKTLGVLAMALTALSCAFPSTAKAAGDIRSIEVYQDAETTERTYPNANAPLVAGETVKFKIRLLNRGTDVATMTANPSFTNPWTMQHVGGNDPIADTNNMPQVGLWISGQRKYAKIESLKLADQYFTEMICSYKVQAGDLAMPLKLVRPDGKGEAMEVTTGSWYSEDYFVKNNDLWNFFPASNGGNTSSNRVEFYFGPTTLGSDVYAQVRTADLNYGSNRDYNLANAGIFIQAVDFDSQMTDDAAYWRSVAAGSTTAVPSLPRLSIPGGSADSQTLYVWTQDPTVAVVDNDNDQDYVFGDGKTRRVSKITVKPGDELVPFRVRGVKEGAATEIYMAATPTNVYNNAGTLVTNFTTRTIWVSEALPPGMTVEINPDTVKTSSDYKLSVASINVQLTQPYTEDLTVTLKPSMRDGSDVDPFAYIGLSTLSDGKEEYSKKELTLKITKGSTSATESLLYLYANRADDHTLKGITFEVDKTALPADAQAFFTGAFSSDTIEIDYDGGALEVLAPLEGTKYEHVPGNVETDFAITITDAIGELNDGTYTVYWDNNGSGSYTAVPGLKADAKGVINVPRRYVTAMTYNSQFYVMNEGGAKSAVRHVVVSVDAPKTVTATMDLGVSNYKEGDTAKVTLDFSDTFQESSNPGYIFIKPLDETTAELVDIMTQDAANHTTSVLVYPGFATANSQASIRLKDGYNGATLSFGIEVREANDDTADNVIAAWVGKQFFIGVTNVVPKISYIAMNETPVNTDGGTFSSKVPIGVQKTFTIGISDPAINVDFADGNKAYTILKFWENGEVVASKLIKGIPTGQSVTHTFMNSGTARVTAKVRDKDMTDQEFDEAAEFTVNVLVVDAPAITLEPYNGSNIFNETDTGVVNGRINVNLTVAPSGLDVSDAITVVLEVTRNGLNDGMMPVLSRYEIPFKNGQTTGNFYLSELDGTPQSELKGFRIRAYIKETTVCPVDTSKTWRQYYTAVDDFDIFVANVAPQIGPGTAVSTNERPASINVPFTITWNAKDVAPDQENMKVTWSYNGSSQTTTQSTTGTYAKEITFTSAGSKVVTLTVEDKDGATDTRSWYYKVEASMGLEITPRRPNTGAFSKFTQKYTGAMGIGAGRVWSTSSDYPTRVSNFTQAWDFQPANDLNPKIYAFGYKNGDTDNGTLGPAGGRDYAVDAAGTWYNQPNRYGSYYVYTNADGKDSFFYCWLLYDRDEGDSSHLNGTIQPQVGNGTGENSVQMPEYDEEAASYVRTMVEAIFAIEFFQADNVGDINQDGIPDVYAAATTWDGGMLYEFAEGELEDGGDLRNVSDLNTDEDYLPSRTARGGTIAQTQQNWARLGGAFDAYAEIRGFGPGLNFRQDNDGMNRNVRGTWISDPSFTPAESNAVARVNGVEMPDPASENYAAQLAAFDAAVRAPNSWIPENRTDPTTDDTDKDGFPDGYEYWFWYSAMVGEMDDQGNIHRLTGSKFDLADMATGVELTPEEIAQAFNPTVKSAARYTERDTDNDGLTDMEEYALGTSPINWDTDGDGLSDFWEVMNGMNPVKTDDANGAAMNADGDFMAKFFTEADYAVVTIDGQEYALPNNGSRCVVFDEELNTWSLTEVGKTNFVAIKVYRYGKPDSEIVPKFRGGQVNNLPGYEGIQMPARPLDVRVWELPEDATVTAGALDQALMLVHDQVYAQLGFDPRTGWYVNPNGLLAERWSAPAGQAINTAPYTARDEYLVLKYRYEQEPAMPKYQAFNNAVVTYSIEADTELWNDRVNRRQVDVFQDGTTKPYVAFENPDWVTEAMGDVTYASADHGADTDGDGVPDGWELYVGQNPNTGLLNVGGALTGTYAMDDDRLGLAAEFAGTDACNAYQGCESIYANHPGNNTGWYNKFFPTDPSNSDTDGDGISDSDEGARWLANWSYGKATSQTALFSFIYGPNENRPAGDNPRSTCIRGGGLNPCTVDTDGDLLPDPWEMGFAGLVFANGRAVILANGLNVVEDDVLTVINRGDGMAAGEVGGEGETTGNQYITAGMDGTDPNDAYGYGFDNVTGTNRDYDFDHDGLQNFQEYLVQAVRQFRYDDSETPLMGSWMPDGPANSRKFVSFLPMNIMDGDTFYAQCKEAGFAATGAWQFRELGYFARPPHEWDPIALDMATFGRVNYDEFGYRIMLPPQGLLADGSRGAAGAYCSTDPRLWDTDGDGMDDYYEMFHGLNPLLGSVQDGSIANDVIAQAYNGQITHWMNGWTAWPMAPWANNGGDPLFDVMAYPWMMGAPEADADGDGLRNINEALLVNMTSPMPTHTDPTPLWYTDASALNDSSFTRQYYQLDSYVLANGGTPDFMAYPWSWTQGRPMALEGSTSGTYMFSFEENEGYDTDNDRIPDAEERAMTASTISDPLNFSDPDRRQALWFPGNESAAVSYSGYFHRPNGDQYDMLRQFTVEAWICPEDLTRDQVILERVAKYTSTTLSNNVGQVRANFRLGILADGRLYGCFDTSDAVPTGTGIGTPTVIGTVPVEGKWVHVALTYDGVELKLHQDGHVTGISQTSLEPANGIVVFSQEALPGMTNFPVLENGYSTLPSAFLLGARALDETAIGLTKETTWDSYTDYYAGYIDEVRVWDGCRTLDEIKATYKTRLRFADVSKLRDEVYAAWLDGATRNDNDGKANLPAELLQHYSFQTLPGAVNATDVMWEPTGFTKNVFDNVRDMDGVLPAGTFECGWWSQLQVHSTVYENYCWVPWIQNTCGHLPIMDGSTVDSRYWSEFFGGATMAKEVYNSRNGEQTIGDLLAQGNAKRILFNNTAVPYSMYNYSSEKAYHEIFLAYMTEADGSCEDQANRYDFEIRSGFVGTSDLLPLGGAFAKRSEKMWDGDGSADAWEITADGDSAFSDVDANGIPDWWQEFAVANYGAAEDFDWGSLVTRDDIEMTAREAYLRDLASGMLPGGVVAEGEMFVSKRDDDKDGLPDWWESFKGISAETAYDDHDNDQLSNYAEYLISEGFSKYGFPRIDPIKPNTFGDDVPDYFQRVGSLYLGEMFADHDFISDAWEDQYPSSVASRGLWDALNDADDDGWSNWAEYQAGTRPDVEASLTVDGATLAEYPVPVVEASIRYNGKKSFSAPIVIQAWAQDNTSDKKLGGLPDAAWSVPTSAEATPRTKILGMNPGRVKTYCLGPGSVVAGTVQIEIKDLNHLILTQNQYGDYQFVPGDPAAAEWGREAYDRPYTVDQSKGEIYILNMATVAGDKVGEIDYAKGLITLDFSQFNQFTVAETENGDGAQYDLSNEATSFVRINWTSQKVDAGNGATFYLGESIGTAAQGQDDEQKVQTRYGHLREGRNLFTAFADLDNSGTWTPGEPYGIAANVQVGWSSASFSIELTDTAPQMARMDLSGLTAAGEFAAADLLTDRSASVNGSYYKNQSVYDAFLYLPPEGDDMGELDPAEGLPAATATTRIRVIRTAVNGELNVNGRSYNEVVLDREIYLGGHPMLSEADLVADGLLDLDWGTLEQAWVRTHNSSAIMTGLTNVTYRVLYGNGSDSAWDFNSFAKVAFVNAFEYGREQTLCEPVSPKGTVLGSPVTFQWKHEALDANGYKVKDYPAFRLQVLDAAGELVFDSGDQPAPARNALGIYSWTAPLYAGMVTQNGKVFSTKETYTWQVSMLDAKFTEPNWAEQAFRLEATGSMNDGRRSGSIAANIRYFGPLAEMVSTDPATVANLIHVQAFTSPDFTGTPVAEGWVTDADSLTSKSLEGVNTVMLSLPAGTYYIAAYVDSNGNFQRDDWESWGYACGVGGSNAEVWIPKAVTVAEPSSTVPSVNIFIEDTDKDNDGFPDAWEFVTFGSLDEQSSVAGDTVFSKVNTGLVYDTVLDSFADLGLTELSSGSDYKVPTLMSVLLGNGPNSTLAAALLEGLDVSKLDAKTSVKIDDFTGDALKVSVTATAEKLNGTKLLAAEPKSGLMFDLVLLSAKTLDGEWTATPVETVVVFVNETTELKNAALSKAVKKQTAEGATFFKVKLIQK